MIEIRAYLSQADRVVLLRHVPKERRVVADGLVCIHDLLPVLAQLTKEGELTRDGYDHAMLALGLKGMP
jgi:hypothetical protein